MKLTLIIELMRLKRCLRLWNSFREKLRNDLWLLFRRLRYSRIGILYLPNRCVNQFCSHRALWECVSQRHPWNAQVIKQVLKIASDLHRRHQSTGERIKMNVHW